MAKLFVWEAACRCADRAVQAFGGRGYRRDNVAERLSGASCAWTGSGGHERDPAADHRPLAGAARRGEGAPLTGPRGSGARGSAAAEDASQLDPAARLAPLLRPRSVAVVGATERPGSYGDQTMRNLAACGFAGPVYGVHPSRATVHGRPCVPSLEDLPEAVDAVVVAIPAAGVPAVLESARARGCGSVVVFAAG